MNSTIRFIPLKRELFERFGLPFSPGTVYQHRCRGGKLRRYTVKDPSSGRILFDLGKWLSDLEKMADREGQNDGRRS